MDEFHCFLLSGSRPMNGMIEWMDTKTTLWLYTYNNKGFSPRQTTLCLPGEWISRIHRQTPFTATVQLPPSELAAYRPRPESNCTSAHSHSRKDPAARPLPDEQPLPGNYSGKQYRGGRLLSALPWEMDPGELAIWVDPVEGFWMYLDEVSININNTNRIERWETKETHPS